MTRLISIAAFVMLALQAAPSGPSEAGHLFFDAVTNQLSLVTSAPSSTSDELWRRDAGRWSRVEVKPAPARRELSGAAYDNARKRLVLFGGAGAGSDTWEWDGRRWHVLSGTSVPPRDHHALAFDARRGRTVMFGGASRDALDGATWEWDGSAWTQVATTGPPVRAHFPMVYDSVRRQVLLYGGLSGGRVPHNDTWAWDGTTWRRLADGGPPARTHHRGAFDVERGVFVVFGGLRSGNPRDPLGDTWTWDGREWREIKVTGPAPRSGHVMAYDPVRTRVVLFGGGSWDGKVSTKYRDLWEWDGKGWTQSKDLN